MIDDSTLEWPARRSLVRAMNACAARSRYGSATVSHNSSKSSSVEGSGDLWTHAASRITKTVPRNGGQ